MQNLPLPDSSLLQNKLGLVNQTIDFSLPGGFIFSPSYLQAGLIVFLLFLLVLTLGQLRHRFNQWTLKGAMPGVAFGFAIALILEGLFLIAGRTIFTEVIGWEDAPKPISNVLEVGRGKLVEVLGVTDTIDESYASEKSSPEYVLKLYQTLTPKESESITKVICGDGY